MFISVSHSDDNTFPLDLRLDIFMDYNIYNRNEINFTINMKVFRKSEMYDKIYIGAFYIDSKELKVADKSTMIFRDQFYDNSAILVDNLFTKYILPNLEIAKID